MMHYMFVCYSDPRDSNGVSVTVSNGGPYRYTPTTILGKQ